MTTFVPDLANAELLIEEYKPICNEPAALPIAKAVFLEDATIFVYLPDSTSSKWEL